MADDFDRTGSVPYCPNLFITSGCFIDCQNRYGGCVVSHSEREKANEEARASIALERSLRQDI